MNCDQCGSPLSVWLFDSRSRPLSHTCPRCEGGETLEQEPIEVHQIEVPEDRKQYLSWCEEVLRTRSGWTGLPLRLDEYLNYERIVAHFSSDRAEIEEFSPIEEDDLLYGLMLVWVAQTLGQSKKRGMVTLRNPPILSEGGWTYAGNSLEMAGQRVAREFAIGKAWDDSLREWVQERILEVTKTYSLVEMATRLRWAQRWTIWYEVNFQSQIESQAAKADRLAETQDLILGKVTELLMSPTARRIVKGENGEEIVILPHKDWSPKLVPDLLRTHGALQEMERQQSIGTTRLEEHVFALCDLGLFGNHVRSDVHAAVLRMREEIRGTIESGKEVGPTIEVDSKQIL